MAGEATLPGDENVIAQLRRARYADPRNEQTMLPDSHVVPDLHQIIDLCSLSDHGFAQGRAIDRGAGSDLDRDVGAEFGGRDAIAALDDNPFGFGRESNQRVMIRAMEK